MGHDIPFLPLLVICQISGRINPALSCGLDNLGGWSQTEDYLRNVYAVQIDPRVESMHVKRLFAIPSLDFYFWLGSNQTYYS